MAARHRPKPADPCTLVLFGATGDLTRRLVVPALYNLACRKILPENFALIGVARSVDDTDEWRTQLRAALQSFVGNTESEFKIDRIDEGVWQNLSARMSYVQGDLTEDALYYRLGDAIETASERHGTRGNVLFYLAIADRLFAPVVEHLGQAKLTEEEIDKRGRAKFWRRVVIEKPFGHDLDSARTLNADLRQSLHEDQIFRIDHFLGKDIVQNILAFRFGNGLFEPIWNRDRIDHVQITVAETIGVEARGSFYEATGALRDMVPNHVLTLLSMVAMEPPVGFDPAAILNKKADLFAAMPEARPEQAVRGQYRAGTVLGRKCKSYRDEPDVAPHSPVETYAALQFEIDNWRWAGVPFFIRTGKHLARRVTEIAVSFKPAPYAAFQNTPVDTLQPNWLVLHIAPDEGISLQFDVKRRGPELDLAPVRMDFTYDDWFPKAPNVGYETLLYDVMIGDATLFSRADMVEAGWRIVQPVLDAWAAEANAIPVYRSGSDGPEAAADLLMHDGKRAWRSLAPIPAGGGRR